MSYPLYVPYHYYACITSANMSYGSKSPNSDTEIRCGGLTILMIGIPGLLFSGTQVSATFARNVQSYKRLTLT